MCQCSNVFKDSILKRIKGFQKRAIKNNEFIIFYVNDSEKLQVRIVRNGETPNQIANAENWVDWTNILEYEHI